LIAAQGGTGFDHSEVAFKSNNITGLYVPYSQNPILTQERGGIGPAFPITSTGHADMVETENGWYAVFLGCRPYEPEFYNTGRETFLTPVQWKDGWPIINPGYATVQYHYPLPLPGKYKAAAKKYGGNFSYKDEFTKTELDKDWIFLRTPKTNWYSLTDKKGFLRLQLLPETCSGNANPAFLAQRQQHLSFYAATSLQFNPTSGNEKAGLLIFQNETHFYFLCKTIDNSQNVICLYKSAGTKMELVKSIPLADDKNKEIQLYLQADGSTYSFYYSLDNKTQLPVAENIDGKFLSTRTAGGFVGSVIGLYATSSGIQTDNAAYFNWFSYKGDDVIYK